MFPGLIEQTQKTLEVLKGLQRGDSSQLAKAGINVATGLVFYSLEPAAKLLYPVITPLRNMIARVGPVTGGAGTAEHWKQITAINPNGVNAMVSEGNRGGVIDVTESDVTAIYKGIGLENSVTFEAVYAGMGFDDARALAVKTLLQSVMIEEEKTILFGNTSLALGTTPTPSVTAGASGGSLATATYFVYCVALTPAGYRRSSVAGGVVTSVTRTNADGSTDTFNGGTAQVSAVGSAAVTGPTGKIDVTVAAVKGAAAYAWYVGTTTGTANCALTAITTVNKVTITTLSGAGTQLANATGLSADKSTNALEFDGLITQALAGSGYYKSLDGATLTADTFGGVVEIDVALKYWWDNFRTSPSCMWVPAQVASDITKKVLAGSTSPSWRINLNSGAAQGTLTGSSLVTSYLNKFSMDGAQEIPIRLHPNMPEGQIFFDLDNVPYPNANVPTARRIRTRQEYYQIEWPRRTRKYEYGVYADEMLQVYVPFGMGMLTNIAAG